MDKEAAEKALSAVNDASGQVALAWASFLSFGTYLAVTIGSTTHLDLLLGRQIKLPVLGVDLGLVTFYWAAPLLFLLFHVYFLIQFYALAGKIHTFNALVADGDPAVVHTLRARLHIVMLTQALAGPRAGIFAMLVRQMTLWLTAVILPVVLFALFLLRFLPYHDEAMTWWHRAALVIDVGFLLFLWPLIFHPSGAMQPIWSDVRRMWHRLFHRTSEDGHGVRLRGVRQSVVAMGLIGLIMVMAVPVVVAVATIPEEPLERRVVALAEATVPSWVDDGTSYGGRKMLKVTASLFEGPIDEVTLAPKSLFSRNLVIVQQDLVEDGAFEKVQFSLNLRGRRLENAVFTGSDLHKADLSGASLDRASLRDANLQGASLSCAVDVKPMECTSLRKADLLGVQLQGGRLWRTNLTGAKLTGAQLQGADLGEAVLDGVELKGVAMQGALLGGARLTDVKLEDDGLAGVSFANMKKSAMTPRLMFARCENPDESIDFLYLTRPPWPAKCEAFTFPQPSVDQVLALYKQFSQSIRDTATRNQVRQLLVSIVALDQACEAVQAAQLRLLKSASQGNATAASLPPDALDFFGRFDCTSLLTAAQEKPGDAKVAQGEPSASNQAQ